LINDNIVFAISNKVELTEGRKLLLARGEGGAFSGGTNGRVLRD
jgi:hypothetical protein